MLAVLCYIYSTERKLERIEELERIVFGAGSIRSERNSVRMAECIKRPSTWLCLKQGGERIWKFEIVCQDADIGFIDIKSCIITILDRPGDAGKGSDDHSGYEPVSAVEDGVFALHRIRIYEIQELVFDAWRRTISKRDAKEMQMSGYDNSHLELNHMVCINAGVNGTQVVWECNSEELGGDWRLRRADVHCEGWDHPDDVFITEGSCSVKYEVVPSRRDIAQ